MQEVGKQKQLKCGLLIAIEGIDGAGKTTQSSKLLQKLQKNGYPAVRFKEPTYGIWGDKIRALSKNGRHKINAQTEFEFFYNDRLEDVHNNINPALEEKKIVIMDRYYPSSVAYQGARGLSCNYIEEKNKEIAPPPNVLIILDLEPEVSLKRIIDQRNETPNDFEEKEYLKNVRKIFLNYFKDRPNVFIIDGDGTRPVQVINQEIWKKVKPIINQQIVTT